MGNWMCEINSFMRRWVGDLVFKDDGVRNYDVEGMGEGY